MTKQEVYVRMANESVYYNRIMVNPEKFENPHFIGEEVFCTIDGIKVAIKKEDWNRLRENTKQEQF
jgi:hypothetical protein